MSGPYILFKTSQYKRTELIYGLLGKIEDIKAIWWQKKEETMMVKEGQESLVLLRERCSLFSRKIPVALLMVRTIV